MADRVTITSGALTARIDALGAELHSLTDADGRELMTDADPAFWTGHAPLLFPVVGRPFGETIRVDGTPYPMPQHGFARRRVFAVEDARAGAVAFVLEDDEATRASYPFAFRLRVTYTLADATLTVAVVIENPDTDNVLPASFGFHPAFAWPLPYGRAREDHVIEFSADEPDALRAIAADGTIAAGTVPTPLDGRVLRLADELFANDALVWDAVRSNHVVYGVAGAPRLRVDFPDTPKLGIWTRPGAHFVCIEPWHGIADPEGYTGEFCDKPGVFEVAPGGTKHIELRVSLI